MSNVITAQQSQRPIQIVPFPIAIFSQTADDDLLANRYNGVSIARARSLIRQIFLKSHVRKQLLNESP